MDDSSSYLQRLRMLRESIDLIDGELVGLLNARARLVKEIGELKKSTNETPFDPPREEAILKRVSDLTQGPLKPQEVRALFAHLIRICRGLEEEGSVAYLGPPGTFSHQALVAWLGSRAKVVPVRELTEIAELLRLRMVDQALFPVENSSEGIVGTSYDLIAEHRFRIVAELILPIHIYLVGRVELKGAKRLYSHVQPYRQAYRYIQEFLKKAEWIETRSSSEAAQLLKEDSEGVALVSPLIAESGEFPILAGPIETQPGNETRFWVVDRGESPPPSSPQKSTLYFILPHRPGTLARVLSRFARARVNLTSIVSRPFPGRSWEYRFFVDVEGNAYKEPLTTLVKGLERFTVEVRLLGAYPCHKLKDALYDPR